MFAVPIFAETVKCAALFKKNYKITEFVIEIEKKEQTEKILEAAYDNLNSNYEILKIYEILKKIRDNDTEKLNENQKKIIINFRQSASFLRSIFHATTKKHRSPVEFSDFVRDFGVLKDYILMDDYVNVQFKAKSILKKYREFDFDSLIDDVSPAHRKSLRKYFTQVLDETRVIMKMEQKITVDEVHRVRKNLRDILRYLQIQNELAFARSRGSEVLTLNEKEAVLQDTAQIKFLKKINSQLGDVCDEFASRILQGEIYENTRVVFPEKIRPRVEWFLDRVLIVD